MKAILLLTGCINPNGMTFTSLNNPEEREKQYIYAILFYLKETNLPIVFSENSGTDISHYFKKHIKSGRLECLTFNGNNKKERGKGYGECEIIRNALKNSRIILSNANYRIIKITGRLIIKNIYKIIQIHSFLSSKETTFCMINSDLSFPDSRIIMANIEFYRTFLEYQERIDDSKGYYFEHALCDLIKDDCRYPFSPFFIHPKIIGMSGSTGEQYPNEPSTLTFSIRYAKFAASQLLRFKKLYRQNQKL